MLFLELNFFFALINRKCFYDVNSVEDVFFHIETGEESQFLKH